jgi:hypothetical protein
MEGEAKYYPDSSGGRALEENKKMQTKLLEDLARANEANDSLQAQKIVEQLRLVREDEKNILAAGV